MCKGGGGTSTNTVVQNQQPPPQIMQAYQNVLNQAQNAVNSGIGAQPYGGQLVAPLSANQQYAAANAALPAQNWQNFANTASQYFQQANQPLWSSVPSFDISSLPGSATSAYNTAGQLGVSAAQTPIAQNVSPFANQASAIGANVLNTAAPFENLAYGIASNLPGQVQPYADYATGAGNNAIGAAQGYGNQAINTAGAYGNQAVGSAQGYAGQATNAAGSAPGLIGTYLSPYTQNVVNATQGQFNNANAIQQNQVVGNAGAQGAWGGDRSAIAQGIVSGQEQAQQAPVIAGLYQQGYQSAVAAAQQQAALQAATGIQAGQLTSGAELGAGQLATGAELGAGQMVTGAELGAGQLGLQAGQLVSQTGLGAGQLGIAAGNLGVQAGQVAGNLDLGAGSLVDQALAQQGQLQLGAGQLEAGIGQGLFGEFNTQQQAQLGANEANAWLASQAGSAFSNMAGQAAQVSQDALNNYLQTGGLQQAQQQAQLNVPYSQYLQQISYPYQSAGFLANITEGLGAGAGGTATTTTPGASALSQVAGLGIGGAGLLGATGAFGSGGWLTGAGGLLGGGAASTAASDAAMTTAFDAAAAEGGFGTAIDFGAGALALERGGRIPHYQGGGQISEGITPSSGFDPSQSPFGNKPMDGISVSVFPQTQGVRGRGLPSPPQGMQTAPSTMNTLGTDMGQLGKMLAGFKQEGLMARGGGIMGYDEGGSTDDDEPMQTGYQVPVSDAGPSAGIVPSAVIPSHMQEPQQKQFEPNPWLALAAAGFGAAAGRSPQAMQNLGAGALEGIKFYEQERQLAPQLNTTMRLRGAQAEEAEAHAEQARMQTELTKASIRYNTQQPAPGADTLGDLVGSISDGQQNFHNASKGAGQQLPPNMAAMADQFQKMGWTQAQIAGYLGGATGESGSLGKMSDITSTIVNPTSGAYGGFQMVGPRKDGMLQAAKQLGISPGDPRFQAAYADYDLKNNPDNARALQAWKAGANDLGQAAISSAHFERAENYDPNHPEKMTGFSGRQAAAQKIFGALGGYEQQGQGQGQGMPGMGAPGGAGGSPNLAALDQTLRMYQHQLGDPAVKYNPQARIQVLNDIARIQEARMQYDPQYAATRAGAVEQAQQNVQLGMKPQIAAATEEQAGPIKARNEALAAALKLPYTMSRLRPGDIAMKGDQPLFANPVDRPEINPGTGETFHRYVSPPMPGQLSGLASPAGTPGQPAAGAGAGSAPPGVGQSAAWPTALGPGQRESLEKRAQHEQNDRDEVVEQAQGAIQQQTTLQRMMDDSENMYTGRFAVPAQELARTLRSFVPGFDDQVAHYEDFVKNAGQLTRAATKEVSSRAAFQEVKFIEGTLPSPEMSPQGLRSVLNEYMGMNDYRLAKARAMQMWETEHGGTGHVEGFESNWAANPPVTPYTFILRRMDAPERQALLHQWSQSDQGRQVIKSMNNQYQYATANDLFP